MRTATAAAVLVGASVAAGVVSAGAPASAEAEVGWPVPTAQATAMEAEFLADPAVPAAVRTAVCEIDSGVADDAVAEFGAGQVTRYAMRDGDPVFDTHAEHHGTWMARYMGAALDGNGMVGIWPAVRIVSVRALVGTGQEFPYTVYKSAIAACLRLQATGIPVVAISLSLGGSASPPVDDAEKLGYAVRNAQERGVAVFAAAGNEPGPVLSPAREAGVIGVGAGSARDDEVRGLRVGRPCAGTAGEAPYSSAGRDLLAPGCALDGGTPDGMAWEGAGSSQATSMTAALYAAGRAYAPAVPAPDVEEALLSSARAPEQGGWVTGQGYFSALGVDWRAIGSRPANVQGEGEAPRPADPPSPDARPGPVAAYPRPALTRRERRGRRLSVAVATRARPAGASLYVRVLDGRRRVLVRRLSGRRSRLAVTLPFGTRSVDVRYRDEGGRVPDSPAVRWTTNVPRPHPRVGRGGNEFR